MIGAFSQKLCDIERKLTDQQKQLNDLRAKVVNSFISDDEIETGQPSLKSMLLRFQAHIKEQAFMHNELRSKVSYLTTELQQLRSEMFLLKSQQPMNTTKATSSGWKYDPTAAEFRPRNATSCQTHPGGSLENQIVLQQGVPLSSEQSAARQCQQVIEVARQAALNAAHITRPGEESQKASRRSGSGHVTCKPCSDEGQQVKDEMLQDLFKKKEDLAHRERDLLSKQEWYEHKMRLLKQDKRRRGETIGKLLRSIDEIRVETSTAPAAQARDVIGRVMQTSSMSSEDRIDAVVDIADAEKSMRFRATPTLTEMIDAAMKTEVTRGAPGGQGQNNNNCQDDDDLDEYDDCRVDYGSINQININ